MSGYEHRPEVARARTLYEKAQVQAALIISEAKIRAEKEAALIREKARAEGLAQAEAELLDKKRRQKAEGEARLRAATAEAEGYTRLKRAV